MDQVTTINFDSKELEIEVNGCSSISAVESTDENLWVGTSYIDGHGAYAAEGLLVIDRETGKIISKIDTGSSAIYGSARDPFSGDVWTFSDQITVVSENRRHTNILTFYYDFDAETGEPEMRLAMGGNGSNPLSFVAMDLPRERQREFYREIKILSDNIVSRFSIETYFFCCFAEELLPKEFNVLLPFVPIGYEYSRENNYSVFSRWQDLACRLDHPDGKELCTTERSGYQ